MLDSEAQMTKLSVNVNKLATIRNARGKNTPDVAAAARRILSWGAHGITVHPRPDGRHIRTGDVTVLSAVVREHNAGSQAAAEYNIEGYPSADYLAMVAEIKPDQATLVPDPPDALTSSAGWAVADNEKFLTSVVTDLKNAGVRVSIFIEPEKFGEKDYEALARVRPDRVELYTEAFADSHGTPEGDRVVKLYAETSARVRKLGIGLNAGHDLNQENLGTLIKAIPEIAEVSIGHALICESLYDGLETTVKNYLRILEWRPSK